MQKTADFFKEGRTTKHKIATYINCTIKSILSSTDNLIHTKKKDIDKILKIENKNIHKANSRKNLESIHVLNRSIQ